MLGVGEVDVGNDVNDTSVGLLGQALVLAAVSRLHVEDRDVEPFCRDSRQAGVGVAENEERVGLRFVHQLIRAVDDIAHGCPEIVAYRLFFYRTQPTRGKLQFYLYS